MPFMKGSDMHLDWSGGRILIFHNYGFDIITWNGLTDGSCAGWSILTGIFYHWWETVFSLARTIGEGG
jgi:hypothetical protein